jgi:hypothetical protein
MCCLSDKLGLAIGYIGCPILIPTRGILSARRALRNGSADLVHLKGRDRAKVEDQVFERAQLRDGAR